MHIPALLQFPKELSEITKHSWSLFGGFATVLFLAMPAAQAGTDGLAFLKEKALAPTAVIGNASNGLLQPRADGSS